MIYTLTLDTTENVMGKGIDISLILKKLGIDSLATGIIQEKKAKIEKELANAEISSHFIDASTESPVTAKSQQALLDYLKEELKAGDIVVIAGKFAPGIAPTYLIDLATLATKKSAYLVIDSPYQEVRDVLPLHPLLLKPNETEIKAWFDQTDKLLTTKQLLDLAHDLVADGADHVLLSLGKEGAAIVNMTHAFMAHAPEVEEVDPVGAGETLLATFLAGMMKNYSPVRNLADSIAAATDTVQVKRLTNFETTPALQRQIISRKISFEDEQGR
ncbi:phosphofructokinase [Lactobacillus sp. PV037]|uniref:PfkB family carbohydrate kinase n=1 Tax=Lactobacillus sp. PV037 TaxID=2594496 RepID=UPI0022403DF7|nr:PfkB family carbohydrate kinase [Lactobacillus sp. PV037]QNQ84210.1 phosphofructokinase [Lactobacillus sp. PV037]